MTVRQRDIIYFDNNATTRLAPEVFETMVPFLTELFGNPSSVHRFGAQIGDALSEARAQVAALIGAEPDEIVFTSCGTESDNAALESALRTTGKRHLITSQVEHSAIRKHADALERRGFRVTYLPVDREGLIDPQSLESALRPDTALVSLMWSNNETGVLFPIDELAALCKRRNVLFHCDAIQAAGKVAIDVRQVPVDFLSLSAHKIHGPKGVGALFLRKKVPFAPLLLGGGQERGRRGGTENVASIVGFGAAAVLAAARLNEGTTKIRSLRDRLESEILRLIPDAQINGHRDRRLPNTSNIAFRGLESEALLLRLDQAGICCSSGSACTTGSLEPSHVLSAMGLSGELARAAIRISLSHDTTDAEVTRLLAELPDLVAALRGAIPAGIQTMAQRAGALDPV